MPWNNQSLFATLLEILTSTNSLIANQQGLFVYSGTPAHGNLIFSVAGTAGTDGFGNAFPQGMSVNTGIIQFTDTILNSKGYFVYSGVPANGNLIISLASSSGTDTFGNAFPQGINVTTGVISGTTITSATINSPVINAGNTIINSSGTFVYSATPAAGNLIASIAPAAGHDGFNNSYLAGISTYDNTNTVVINVVAGVVNSYSFLSQPNATFGKLLTLNATTNSQVLQINNALDGNNYVAGQDWSSTHTSATINSTSHSLIRTIPLSIGLTYEIYVRMEYNATAVNAGAPILGWHGGSIAFGNVPAYGYGHWDDTPTNGQVSHTWVGGGLTDITGPVFGSTAVSFFESRWNAVPTSSGTLGVSVACTVAADTWVMQGMDVYWRILQ